MKSISWAKGLYLAGVVLAIALFLPQSWFPLLVGKIAAAAVLFALSGLVYLWALWRGEAQAPSGAALSLLLLPLGYLLSWAFSADRALGLVGQGIGSDSLLFVTLLALTAILGSALFRTSADVRYFFRTLMWALVAAVIFQCIVLIFSLPGPFTDRSVNLIGKWNDFGAAMTMLAFLLLGAVHWGARSARARVGAWAGLILVLALLAMVNFSTAWGMLLALALVVALAAWGSSRRIPWGALVCAVVAGIFLFFGAAINTELSKIIPVSSLEVRPSLQSTFDVTAAAHGASVKDAALGTGPNTFGLSWLMHKPASVNQSVFWNLDFVVGFSTLATVLSTTGLLGVMLWLLPLLLVLIGAWRMRGTEHRAAAWTISGAVLLWWTILLMYVPSQNLEIVAFATAGAGLGLLWPAGPLAARRPVALGSAIVLVVLLLIAGGESARRFVAESYVGQASDALTQSNADSALSLVARSVSVEATPENLRLAVAAGAAKLQQLAAATVSSSSQQIFAAVLQQTIAAGQRAITLDPDDYQSYVSLGQLYGLLAANQVQGAYDSAKADYQSAAALAPLDPTVPLLSAELEASAGSAQGFEDALKQSLTLKPDYTDAILFLAQVDIARNDLASAITDTQNAAQTAPGVPSIWLQLGLLYYSNNDTKDAIPPLEQALQLQPGYANAQYFLGLSYDAQGRPQDALALFEQLNQSNPGNAQVESALANIQAGKPALDTATSTPTTAKTK